ncbi:MAG: bifunctional pyr operon transcriptional regulator/uracil phosphoribosyltransferase PyrR [Desulfobacterota bacterium]|nr:bifunctional pyr operon transcriptional regulator/uracil phosphoribosyltransferase PyrR [Thermodesulfobacteriota bacterium]MDW8002311.1 bifunctional pyr operon transcriptional regulator/uracil phosphoribosyltransferase PyrR [Deltaproteobacteria bacterium]
MEKVLILGKKALERVINRICYEIVEKNHGCQNLSLIGIRTRGVYLASRIREGIKSIESVEVPMGILDITMYRDDIFKLKSPRVRKTEISFDVNNMVVVLVDDVIHTGRTIRAAIDAIMDIGRPKKIQLAVIVDRNERELPIHPDYTGIHYRVSPGEEVLVRLKEVDGADEVIVTKTE